MKIKKKNIFETYLKKYSYDTNKIIGFNPSDFNEVYLLENGVLSKSTSKDIKSEYLLSTYIPNEYVITYEFKLQKNLLDKIDLNDYVETKCYEDVGLDEAEEYVFKYKLVSSIMDEKNILVEVIIISKKNIEEYYQPLIKKYGFLDFISYSGFLFNVLYTENILVPQNDLFILFAKENIVITLYSEGKFLQTSLIPEGLEYIYKEWMESLKAKNFEFNDFMELILKRGLDANNYSEKELMSFNELSELISNKFLLISNQIYSITRKFSLTTIDRIFMGTLKGIIPGVSEFANMYLGVESNDLKFDINYNPNNIEIDQMLFLSMLSASSAYKKNLQEDNLTLFYRPPTFFYRRSGQFISISVISILLSLMYPTYQSIKSYFISLENHQLSEQLHQLENKNKILKATNTKLSNQLKVKKKEKNDIITYIKDRQEIVTSIYLEKNSYTPKALLIAQLTKYLYNNRVYLDSLSYDNNFLILNIYSIQNKNITNFINEIVEKEHLIVTTMGYKKINNFYVAKIKVKVSK